jgi:hypothetical protein
MQCHYVITENGRVPDIETGSLRGPFKKTNLVSNDIYISCLNPGPPGSQALSNAGSHQPCLLERVADRKVC